MNVKEEVALAVEMGIESALEFVYLAKLNANYRPDGYYAYFNNKLVFISCLASGKRIDGLTQLYINRPNLRKIIAKSNPHFVEEIWDQRTNQPFPDRYHADQVFHDRYELKRVAERIGTLQAQERRAVGAEKDFIRGSLTDAYMEESGLHRHIAYLQADHKENSLVLADTKNYPLLELIAGYGIHLTRVGNARYRALCPFHNEKTPSFYVFGDQNRFKCFGCQEGGDPIDFVTKYEKISIIEAAKKLST